MTTEIKEITLKPETEAFAAQVKGAMKIEHTKGNATAFAVVDPSFYASTLPDSITVKQIEDLQSHNALFAAGTARALSQLSEEFMKKHKDVTRVSADITTVKKDGFELTYDRERSVPSRNEDGTTGTAAQYGSIRVAHRAYAAEAVGELKKVKQLSVQSAARVLGG
jgi:hypothetical protein